MKTNWLLILTVIVMIAAPSWAAEYIVNGDFDNATGGVPDGWTYLQGDGPAQPRVTNAPLKPTSFNDPGDQTAIYYTDGTTELSQPRLTQVYDADGLTGQFVFSLDFYLDGTPTGDFWAMLMRGRDSGGAQNATNLLNSYANHVGGDYEVVNSGGANFSVAINGGQWYRTVMTFDTTSLTFDGAFYTDSSGTLTELGSWTDYPFNDDSISLTTIMLMDLDGQQNPSIYFDNVSLTDVPEPATMGLLSLGGLALLKRRRK